MRYLGMSWWKEEVYAWGYTTSGNYWWEGTMSGYHVIKMGVAE